VPEQSRSERRAAERDADLGWWRKRRAAKKRRLARMSRKKRIARRVGLLLTWMLAFFALLTTTLAFYIYRVSNVPRPDELVTNQTATLAYSDGSTMATLDAGENRTNVPLSKVPDHVKWAVLAAEDRSFYSDPGVSIKGTVRAAVNDVTGGNRQGGSGITQQYVKNAYLNDDQTLSRKLKELAIALKLDREYSKDQILEYYLNTIYWGRGNTYGIAAAAEVYFGVPVNKLTVSQGALLAGIIKAPNFYDPASNLEGAKNRWSNVVDGMVSTGKLTQAQRTALTFPATVKKKSQVASVLNGPLGMVRDRVLAELPADIAKSINTRGLRIVTTINPVAQLAAETAVRDNFANLTDKQKQEGMRPALTAVNPATGAVLAYYGGPKGTDFDFANGYRPPGSSFKPYTLATALQQNIAGKKPAYAISSSFDGNQCVTIKGTKICNDPSDAPYAGFRRLDYAMKVSLNTTFDGLADAVGPDNVARTAWAMGIRKTNDKGKKTLVSADGSPHFGIGIGDSDYAVRPLDQAVGFATIANGGTTRPAYFVQKVTDSKGKIVYQHTDAGVQSLDPRVANDVGLTLKPVADWSGMSLADGRESGAKTGTAGIEAGPGVPAENVGKNSDAWMVGYTPQVSASVWVGTAGAGPISNSDGGQEYGRDLPGKTWKAFMDAFLAGKDNLPLPTTQQIIEGSNIQPTAVPSSSKPSSTAPTTTAPTTTKPRTTAPGTTAPTTPPTPTPMPTPICTPPIVVGPTCPPTQAPPSQSGG
jgi:membrane peptidoglycan carboxypeptidase